MANETFPWEVYRDATFTREQRDSLLVIEKLVVAAIDDDLLPQYSVAEREMALRHLREVMDAWDRNDATEIIL